MDIRALVEHRETSGSKVGNAEEEGWSDRRFGDVGLQYLLGDELKKEVDRKEHRTPA